MNLCYFYSCSAGLLIDNCIAALLTKKRSGTCSVGLPTWTAWLRCTTLGYRSAAGTQPSRWRLLRSDCLLCCWSEKSYFDGDGVNYRVFRKNCVFSQFTATPPSPTSLWETFKALNVMRVYSHSYWLVIFVQPIADKCWRGRGGKLSTILGKKHNI